MVTDMNGASLEVGDEVVITAVVDDLRQGPGQVSVRVRGPGDRFWYLQDLPKEVIARIGARRPAGLGPAVPMAPDAPTAGAERMVGEYFDEQIENLFDYHAPSDDQRRRYQLLRQAAKRLAYSIDALCPQGPDRTAAMRKLREALMTANAAVATKGGNYR